MVLIRDGTFSTIVANTITSNNTYNGKFECFRKFDDRRYYYRECIDRNNRE